MSEKHEHDDCNCDHHDKLNHSQDNANPCRTEMFIENLLKTLEEDEDLKEKS